MSKFQANSHTFLYNLSPPSMFKADISLKNKTFNKKRVEKQKKRGKYRVNLCSIHFSSLPLVFLYTISLKLDRILLSLFLLSSWLKDARALFSSAL